MRKSPRILALLAFAVFFQSEVYAQQVEFSLATDLGVMRSFKKGQRFFSFGHTIQGQFHIAPKDAVYVWLSYYLDGKFRNDVTATAKLPSTTPAFINYTNKATMRLREFSIGWKRFLKGHYANEESNNLYGYAGFGLLFGRASNEPSVPIDTSLYTLPVLAGNDGFKRMTVDLGLGLEVPIGNALFIYGEGRVWIPTTDYPSKYLYLNNDAPLMGMINVGLRILFD